MFYHIFVGLASTAKNPEI